MNTIITIPIRSVVKLGSMSIRPPA
ncbi:MAG: hypothetical protein JG775_1122, partial [Defluviitaleaceae bacterium]|nr:hypothetical protein [Defluviitaleaceae bacterium]